jgi:hypothetical protein
MGQSNGGGGGGARQHSRESGGGSRGNWGEWEWDRKGGGVISRKNGSEEANVSVCAKCCSRGTTCAADTCGDRNECGDGDPKANTRATGWCDSNVLRRERREMQRNNLALAAAPTAATAISTPTTIATQAAWVLPYAAPSAAPMRQHTTPGLCTTGDANSPPTSVSKSRRFNSRCGGHGVVRDGSS